jgi:hypothetical protein
MRKKCLILLAAVLIGLSFHACSLPDSINRPKTIKIKGSPDYDLLLNITGIDLGRIYIDMLREQLAGIGSDQLTVDVWEVDYKQKEQTFLLKLSTTLTNSLNPGTYLNRAGFKNNDFVSAEPFPIDYSVAMPSIEIKQTVGVDFSSLLSGATPGTPVTIPAGSLNKEISIPNLPTINENDTGFFHALIDEVVFEIGFEDDPGGSVLTGVNLGFTFNAQQNDDGPSYPGLSDGSETLSPGNLEGKNINKKELRFSEGQIKITNPQDAALVVSQEDKDAGTLTKNLTVTMNITKLKDVKWDFAKVSEYFRDATFPPYSLAEPARYVKKLYFDICNGTDKQGIGLKAGFDEVIPGLLLNIKCEGINVVSDEEKELKKGDIIFGNTNGPVTLELEEYKDDNEKSLEYKIKLEPANGNVLKIENLTLGKEQALIKGKVGFFHEWAKAVLDMKEIIKIANMTEDDFMGAVPNVFKEGDPEDPIDLSMMTKYFEGGFTFEGIKTNVYLSGPKDALSELLDPPNLEFSAKRVSSDESLELYNDELVLSDPVKINLNNNGYYFDKELPPNGMHIEDDPFARLIDTIINDPPADLYFQYNLTMDEYLTVTRGMFEAATDALDEDEDENDVIIVDVLVLLPLKLRVTDTEGLRFLFDEFIGEQTDLFGRENPGEATDFSNMKMPALHVSLEFPEQIFSGGTIKLFTDRVVKEEEGEERGDDPLFRGGIPLKGKSMKINVSSGTLTKVLGTTEESRLLILNPLVEFKEKDTITIPRNAGLMRIKLGFSGDYTIDADDLGLW